MGNLAPLVCLFFVALFGICPGKGALWFSELESLDSTQKDALKQLKTAMSSAPHDYMKEDIYLVKFLQAADYDPAKAASMMNDMIKWRQDKVRQVAFGKWNIEDAIEVGKGSTLLDYSIRALERSATRVRRRQATGKNVTQWTLLISLDGFRTETHACKDCRNWVSDYIKTYENYYPNTLKEVVLVYAQPAVRAFYEQYVKKMLSPSTEKLVTIFYGQNGREWEAYLTERVDPRELAMWFGGKKPVPRAG